MICKLIKENVKVINVSLSTLDELYVKSVKNNTMMEALKDSIEKRTKSIKASLKKLLDKKYDFVIVVSSGNNNMDAKYSNFLNNISDNYVDKHIIVVGGIQESVNSNYEMWYKTEDNASNWGSRVDVVAPAKDIPTIAPSFATNAATAVSGTSAAAPHVAGIAGMMYSVNPNLTGDVVKYIIKQTSQLRKVTDSHKDENGNAYEYGIADAKLAVSTAYYFDKSDKIVFGKLEDYADPSKVYADTDLRIKYTLNGITVSQKVCSDKNGEFEIVVPKDINESDLEIESDGYAVMETERLGIFWGSTAVINVKLTPIDITVKGSVKEHNIKTNSIKPINNFTVTVYKKAQSNSEVDTVAAVGKTDSLGNYEIKLDNFGEYIVKFSEDKQELCSIHSNGKYMVNAIFEVKDDDKDTDEDKDDNNENKPDDGDWNDIGDTGLTFDFDGDGGTSFTGDGFTGDLFSGIWLKTSNGTDNYYVRIYTTNDVGEYTGSIGAQGCGIYTTTYHHWIHELKMATYKTDGTLINEQTLDYFYEKVYVYLPEEYRQFGSTETTPLMKIEAIISASLRNDSISYIIHTDGYYKETVNFIGFIGICKEKWEKDETKTVIFYNNSKCTGVSYKSPFESE